MKKILKFWKKNFKKILKIFWNIFDVLSLPPTAAPSPRCLPPRGTTPGWCYLQIVLNWRKNYKSFCLWGTTKKFKILKKNFKKFLKKKFKKFLKKILNFFFLKISLKYFWCIIPPSHSCPLPHVPPTPGVPPQVDVIYK